MRDETAERAGLGEKGGVSEGDVEGALPTARPMSPALPLFALGALPGPLLHVAGHAFPWVVPLFFGAGLVLSVGATAGSRRRPSPWRVMAATVLATAGVFTLLTAPENWSVHTVLWPGPLVTLTWGAVLSVPLLPFPLMVYHGCSRVGRARPGSLCDRADRRAPWVLTLGALGWFACATLYLVHPRVIRFVPPPLHVYLGAPTLLVALIMLALLIALAIDHRALRRCTEVSVTPGVATWTETGGTVEQPTRYFVDLGVGEERWLHARNGGSPYRDGRRAELSLAGNPQMARELLADAVRRDLLLLASMALWLPPYLRNLI